MVVSRLNKHVTYQESKRLEKEDISKKSILYELEIENKYIPKVNIVVAIGNARRKYEKIDTGPGIVYFPIYLITKNKNAIQIGVYEIFKNEIDKFVDKETQEIQNYDLFEPPLLWSWVDNSFIVENRLSPIVFEENETDNDEDVDSEDDKDEIEVVIDKKPVEYIIPEHRKDIFTIMRDVRPPEKLKEENRVTAKYLKKENDLNWISQFLKNEHYDIIDKDNLFHAIQSAFEQIGQQTHETKLRKKMVDSKWIESYFHHQKSKYNELVKYSREIQKKLDTAITEKENYKKLLKQKKESSMKLNEHEIKEYNQLKENIEIYTIQKSEIKKLMSEYDFIKTIHTVDQMRDYMLSKKYHIDEEGLSFLEKVLKIKFILFNEDSHRENDLKGMIDCGAKDEKLGKFQPEYYILLEYSQERNRYNLVSYKHKRIFAFSELPYDLKNIISYKCVENVDGNFRYIPEWVKFHKEVTKRGDLYDEDSHKDIDVEDITSSGIMRKYDGVKINIYCHSSREKFPGKIRGETIPFDENMIEYTILSSIKNWRCILDNNWTGTDVNEKGSLKSYQFELNGYYWASVQHYVQACKFREDNLAYYTKFALGTSESDIYLNNMNGKDLSNNVELAIFIGTKSPGKLFKGTSTGELKGYQRDKKIQIDRIYNEDIEARNLKDALYAKFSQNPTFKKILISTRNSQLFYTPLKRKPQPAEELMVVREMLMR